VTTDLSIRYIEATTGKHLLWWLYSFVACVLSSRFLLRFIHWTRVRKNWFFCYENCTWWYQFWVGV